MFKRLNLRIPDIYICVCSKYLLHNNFWTHIYPGTTPVLLTINVNTQIQSRNYRCQIKGHYPQHVYQNREPHKCNLWCINATITGAISLAINIKRKLPTFNAKSTEQLLSGSKQYGVSISTNVFEVYMLQVQVNRRNYNSYVVIYRMINRIMLGITAQLK